MFKPFYIFLFFTLFCCEAKTQTNLVYNGDFEIYDTCPTTISTPGNYQIEHCLGWYAPTYATSDYYNKCASWPVGIPVNTFGFQSPYSGNAYTGVLIQNCTQVGCDGWWVEYVQSKLITPLTAGIEYNFSFNTVGSDHGWEYSFWKLGAYFSNTKIANTTAKPFTNVVPQILNTPNNYLTDTLNWTEIKGSFVAKGGEEFVTIGYFPDTLNIDSLRLNLMVDATSNFINYYYIDDVKLFEKECISILPNIFTPNNDNINELFKFSTCSDVIKTTLYNRWGNKVFETTDITNYWDGKTTSGKDCNDGNYYYIIETKEKTIKGFVQLIR